MILWPYFLTLALLNLGLVWRDKPLRWLALCLLGAWAGANAVFYAYPLPYDRVTANAIVDLGFGFAALGLFSLFRRWQIAAMSFVAIIACCAHLTFGAIPDPDFRQSNLYEVSLNWLFVLCLIINSGGRIWGYARAWRDRVWGRNRHSRRAVRRGGD